MPAFPSPLLVESQLARQWANNLGVILCSDFLYSYILYFFFFYYIITLYDVNSDYVLFLT